MNLITSSIFVAILTVFACGYANPYIQSNPTPVARYLKNISLTEPSSGLAGIDCIYVINLDKRPERWERTKRIFNNQGCTPNRISAVNGWELTAWDLTQLYGPHPVSPKAGIAGCLLSHVSIYKDAYERGFETIWICEDDIEFSSDIKKLSHLISELYQIDKNWDLLYTDYSTFGADYQVLRQGQSKYKCLNRRVFRSSDLVRMHGRFQTHSMIFSRNGIKKALDYFTHVYILSAIDIDIHYVPGFREYSTLKDIVTYIKDVPYSDTEHQ